MERKINILIVEDDQIAGNYLSAILSSGGYDVMRASTGKQALSMSVVRDPDLILLDLGLPDIDGKKILKSVLEWSEIPIIVISGRTDEREKVEVLDAGADDYITKPFGNNELLARIRTVVRLRKKIHPTGAEATECFTSGDIHIDYGARTVKKAGVPVHLTPIEYKIIVLLSQNSGKVLTHDFIIENVWGIEEIDCQLLRVNMANIRRKLEDNPADPKYILTEVRVGYKMVEPVSE